jgi:RNA polymerase sigma-70 factor (ECF subfamily)
MTQAHPTTKPPCPAATTVTPVLTHRVRPWEETRAQLLGFVSRRVECADAAEDIVQDVLERVQRTDVAAITNLQAWLYRAARNAIVDHYRQRRPTTSFEDADEVVDRASDIGDTEPVAAIRELAHCLRPLIDQLADDSRDAVTLVDLDGRTHHDAARLAGISTSGMKSRVQRGRKQLASLLQDCCTITRAADGAIHDYTHPRGECSC